MNRRHTSISKITQPRLPKIYARTRLFRLLDQGRRYPVTWITGPPGSGKTTLVASYLDARKLPCLWYQVDEGDADLATFFYYLGLAAKKTAPRIKQPLPLLTPEYQFGIPTFTRRYFEDFFSRMKPHHVIVFDNYQQVPAESPCHEVMLNGLSEIPQDIRVIIISRTDPPAVFARLEANKIMSIIGWEQLRLTPEETSGMMKLRTGKPVSQESQQKLYEKTSGWAAGVVLMEVSLRRSGVQNEPEPMAPGQFSAYFTEEIFKKIDGEMQDFLLKTAYLPRMTPHMAEAITGNSRSGQILAELNRRNYFTERRPGREISYQYHALFREFLQRNAEHEFSEFDRTRLQLAAAKLLEESGQIEDAAELLRRAEAWGELAGLILKSAPEMVRQGRLQTLRGWIESLPKDITARQPWLLYWLGICNLPFSPTQSGNTFERAFELFKARKDAAGLFLSLSGMFEAVALDFNNFIEYDRLIPILYELLNEFTEYPSREIEAHMVGSMLYAIDARQPQHPDLEYWISRGSELAKSISDVEERARILLTLGLIPLFAGELEKTAIIFDSFREAAITRHVTPSTLVILRTEEAHYAWLAAEFDKNRKASDEAIALANTTGVHMLDMFILGNGAAGALSTGELKRADELLKRMRSCLDGKAMSWGENFYHNLVAWKCLLQGDLARASLHADLSFKFGVELGFVPTEAYHYLIKAIVMHELKKKDEESVYISEVRRITRTVKMYQNEFRGLLAEAQFAFDRSDEVSGMKLLAKAMALGRERGYYNAIFWVPSVVAKLCVKSLEADIEVEYVRDLIRKRDLVPDEPPLHIENWPWPVKIATLGRFEILKDDKPLRFSGKVQKKPLEMLKALIAFGGREVPGEQIAAALWPDADGDAAYKAFGITLIRLREMLGVKDAVQLREGNVTLDQRYFWIDTWAFEHMLESSEFGVPPIETFEGGLRSELNAKKRRSAIRIRQSEIHLGQLEKAINLYAGPFIVAESAPWAISLRERLRDKFLRCVEKLGLHWEERKAWEKAIDYYKKGLEADDLVEEFYRRIIICHQRLGRSAEALSVYNRCKKTLAAYGVEPSEETERMYEQIKARRQNKGQKTLP